MEASVFVIRGKMKALFGDAFTYPATPYFLDVPATDPSFPYIQKMRELGYTSGCTAPPAANFCPWSTLTRDQISVFLVRGFLN